MEQAALSIAQTAYKVAVDKWVIAIRAEEELAFTQPTTAHVDDWENAHFKEEEARNKVLTAKREYEDEVRRALFLF